MYCHDLVGLALVGVGGPVCLHANGRYAVFLPLDQHGHQSWVVPYRQYLQVSGVCQRVVFVGYAQKMRSLQQELLGECVVAAICLDHLVRFAAFFPGLLFHDRGQEVGPVCFDVHEYLRHSDDLFFEEKLGR
jgi:hypothetical protein